MTLRSTTHRPASPAGGPALRLLGPLAIALAALGGVGCTALGPKDPTAGGNPLIPTRYQAQVGSFRVASNSPLHDDDPALAVLADLEARLGRVLGVRVPEGAAPIDVAILDDDRAFTTFLTFHHPELPSRRAFFLAVGDSAAVYTARGEHLEEDLRHEATHALLHRAGGPVPLWLDEGLAEYFEVEPRALPSEAIDRFRRLAASYRQGWRPDLRRLEAIDDVAAMTPTDYREAWAWTLLLLHGPRRGDLVAHLDRIRTDGPAAPALSEELRADLAQLNRQFLARVAPKPAIADAPALTRLQSPPTTSAPGRPAAVPAGRAPVVQAMPLPLPPPPPPGPIGRIGRGIGDFFDRLTSGSRWGPG